MEKKKLEFIKIGNDRYLIKDSNNLICFEVLTYNKYAGGKYKLANQEYRPLFNEDIPSNPRFELFEKANIKVRRL